MKSNAVARIILCVFIITCILISCSCNTDGGSTITSKVPVDVIDVPTVDPQYRPHNSGNPITSEPGNAEASPSNGSSANPAIDSTPSSVIGDTETPSPQPNTGGITLAPTENPTNTNVNGEKVIYLTFDDGPCELTYELLDILDEYGIKVTFFTVGFFVDRYPEIVREAASRGHLIACHTYSHEFASIYASADAFMEEIRLWEEAVVRALGELPQPVCVRFPGGSHTSYLPDDIRCEIIARLDAGGYSWYNWNLSNNDKWFEGNTEGLPIDEYLMQSYLTTLAWCEKSDSPLVFLAHDTSSDTIGMISKIIDDLIARGYSFKTLADCPK